jgi:DNA mismatch repair protein MutL
MNKIRLLSDNTINQIAAGEVIDRPSSAVKELIENSLDANSSKINIYVKNGGKKEIIVSDDGDGIQKNDLKLAITRHATSKLDEENINEISSMGFRGEALPSIGSVSKMIIKSNINENQDGNKIEVTSGNIKTISPINQKKGTTVEIRDLFFSTPARLNFLKSENYETLLIKKIVQRLAICNYKTEFNLFVNGKNVISTKKSDHPNDNENFMKRIRDLLGNDFLDNSIFFDQKVEDFNFKGLLGIPTFHHSNTNNQFLFINKRVIQDKSMNVIFKLAYRDFMSYDRFPQLVVFIDCPTDKLDVNVHPSKNEVRFRNLNLLRSNILKTFKEKLAQAGHKASTVNTTRAVNKFYNKSNFQTFIELKEENIQESTSENLNVIQENESSNDENEENFFPLGYAKSQFHKTYIVSEIRNGIVIVDQHAAHERLVYEKLKKDFYEKKIQTQILLIPVVIDLDPNVVEGLKNFINSADNYGVKLEVFGKKSILVREVPSILANCNIKKLVMDLVEEITEINEPKSLESKINAICSKMACHGSIRAGRELQIDEMNDLLRKMESTPFSGQCNHGRPTYVQLNIEDIEKLFGRK